MRCCGDWESWTGSSCPWSGWSIANAIARSKCGDARGRAVSPGLLLWPGEERNWPVRREPGAGTGYHGIEGEERVKPLRWTSHALQALDDRGIDRTEVERTIAVPELSVVDPPRRSVLMRRYVDARLGRQMLLRVVIEETPV